MYYREQESESPARLNRVLAQARRNAQDRQRTLSAKELLTTSRLQLGLLGPRILSQHLGRTINQQQ